MLTITERRPQIALAGGTGEERLPSEGCKKPYQGPNWIHCLFVCGCVRARACVNMQAAKEKAVTAELKHATPRVLSKVNLYFTASALPYSVCSNSLGRQDPVHPQPRTGLTSGWPEPVRKGTSPSASLFSHIPAPYNQLLASI